MKIILNQIDLMWKDIKQTKGQFWLGLIQILIASIVLCYTVQIIFQSIDSYGKLQNLNQNNQIYYIDENMESSQIDELINAKDGWKTVKELDNYMNKSFGNACIQMDSSSNLYFYSNNLKQIDISEIPVEEDDTDVYKAKSLKVSSNFFSTFQIAGDYNREEIEKQFKGAKAGETLPIILGNNYKEQFHVGDQFEDDLKQKYKVVGFFKEGESYISPFETSYSTLLDDYMVTPAVIKHGDTSSLLFNVTNRYFVTNDKAKISQIVKKANTLKIRPLIIKDLKPQITACKDDMANEIITMSSIALLIFAFASIGIINYFIRFIAIREKEFAIHMLIGATKEEVIARIRLQLIFMIGIILVGLLLCYGSCKEVYITVGIGVIYGELVLRYPIYIFKQQSIVRILRRNMR
ncbi:MAG: ABC transporter permease [Anaerostipes sp.]|nr:ABC transporter permease [Anaerostipes sp.]MDD3747677.1 ABC transporter permease [Anaerostipes sp.]